MSSETGSAPPRMPPLLHVDSLSALTWLRHGFTTRAGGVSTVYGRPDDLNLGKTPEDSAEAVRENRRLALQTTAADTSTYSWELTQTRQIHSATILTLSPEEPHPNVPADGLVTSVPGSMLAVLAADCVPILLADRHLRVVAAIHAGWRGTVAGILQSAVEIMQTRFGSNPVDLIAAIGPSIGPCCYTVGEEVHTRLHEAFPYAADLLLASRLSLWEANRRQLLHAGLSTGNIAVMATCTACSVDQGSRSFFSHRADHGRTGRMMALIGIVPHPVASS